MVALYAVATVAGLVSLTGWILAASFESSFDPETRFGVGGRRFVAGVTGFGLGGMAAAYSPLDLNAGVEMVAALVGAGVAVWYAGWAGTGE